MISYWWVIYTIKYCNADDLWSIIMSSWYFLKAPYISLGFLFQENYNIDEILHNYDGCSKLMLRVQRSQKTRKRQWKILQVISNWREIRHWRVAWCRHCMRECIEGRWLFRKFGSWIRSHWLHEMQRIQF